MAQTAVEKFSAGALADLGGRTQRAFDPTMILTIGQIVIELIQNCKAKKAAQFKEASSNPSFLEKIAVRRHLVDSLGRQDFRAYGQELMDSLQGQALKMSEVEWDALVKEARS